MKTIKGSELQDKTLEVLEDGTLRIIESCKFLPQNRDVMWIVNVFGDIDKFIYNDTMNQYQYLINHQPSFRTKEECKEYKRYLDLLDEYTFKPNWKDDSNKYYIYYEHRIKEILISFDKYYESDTNYFETKGKAKEFIKKAGEENVKKFMFDIWE